MGTNVVMTWYRRVSGAFCRITRARYLFDGSHQSTLIALLETLDSLDYVLVLLALNSNCNSKATKSQNLGDIVILGNCLEVRHVEHIRRLVQHIGIILSYKSI